MVEPRILWSCGKLYIWKSELIFPSDKQNYSELSFKALQSNLLKQPHLQDNHLSKMTNAESAQANSHTIIPV